MTFYEAALRVLEAEGRPLHFSEITEKSIQQNLLSHIGKTPEQTMLSRLAAMARRTRDRKVTVTAKDTFALVEWQLPEDAEALAQTGVPEPNPEEALPPLRPTERHPDPRTDNVRGAGRIERDRGKHRRREEEEEGGRGKRRRFPPIPEVAFEILSESGDGLRPDQLVAAAKDRQLAGDELGPEQVLIALLEDNQRRIDAGRRPQFVLQDDSGLLVLERASAPSAISPQEMQAAFAAALNLPMEGGRPVLPRSAQPAAGPAAEEAAVDSAPNQTAKLAVKDARKAVARALRRKLSELDTGTFEKSVVKMLHGVGFRELKVAKRSKDGPLLTARKREGSVELRFAVRMLRGSPAIDRRMVQELRRDLGHYSAQVGLLASAGEVRGDARTEAQAAGALVMLWCGDALGDKFLEARAGVSTVPLELFEVDDRFFETARVDAEEAARRREERHREKQQREGSAPPRDEGEGEGEGESEPSSRAPEPSGEPNAVPSAAGGLAPPEAQDFEGDGDEGEDEEDDGPEGEEPAAAGAPREGGAPGQPGGPPGPGGERKRRRRRRRGRRGRGPRPEGAPGQPGQPGQSASGQPGGAPAGGDGGSANAAPPAPAAAPEPPPPPPPSGGEPGQG